MVKVGETKISIYKNLFSKDSFTTTIDKALERIKTGKSRNKIIEIRATLDENKQQELKRNLPSVRFAGIFEGNTSDISITNYSNFLVLDFDHITYPNEKKHELAKLEYCYAVWISPRGEGVKMLVRIADGKKHREHFSSLAEVFPDTDKQCINISRVCFESWDEDIIINPEAKVWTKWKKELISIEKTTTQNEDEIIDKLLKWLANKNKAFNSGERNAFIFTFAGACCRYGIYETNCINFCVNNFNAYDTSFSIRETEQAVKSAYRKNRGLYGTAAFENSKLIHKTTRGEVDIEDINPDIYDIDIKPKDVIYGIDVKEQALKLYDEGYVAVDGIGIPQIDNIYKMKRGEITLLTGIGNYGKSSFLKYYLLMRCLKFGEKFALFSPEDNPAEEFYHDLCEIYFGCDCTPANKYNRPTQEQYSQAYDEISKHIFYIYPKELAPTPSYIKERFLELIIKEKISGCIVDPFNQLSNDYGARSDKYLESLLSDFSRFAIINNVYFIIVAHPSKMQKLKGEMSYPCPDVYDIADGAMWNNKMDNILVYHRPNHQEQPDSSVCELHSKKIRRQKIVGNKGVIQFELNRAMRRYFFDGHDYMKYEIMKIQPPKEEMNDEAPF